MSLASLARDVTLTAWREPRQTAWRLCLAAVLGLATGWLGWRTWRDAASLAFGISAGSADHAAVTMPGPALVLQGLAFHEASAASDTARADRPAAARTCAADCDLE